MNNFRSQICTSIEQSQRLLDLGLKPETADMSYYILDDEPVLIIGMTKVYRETRKGGKIIKKQNAETIPAWSLHRLIELLPQRIHLDYYEDTHYWLVIDPLKVIYKNSHGSWIYQCDEGGLYDKLINTIEWTIKNNHFNKEYLKNTKQ
jgi:hypothetical protein